MASWNDKNSSRVFVEGNFINVKNYSVYDSRLHIYQLQVGFLLTFLVSWAALFARMYTRQKTFDWPLSVSHSHFFYVIFPSRYTTISPFHTRNYEISLSPRLARWPRYNQKNARPLSPSLVSAHDSTVRFIVCGWPHGYFSDDAKLRFCTH